MAIFLFILMIIDFMKWLSYDRIPITLLFPITRYCQLIKFINSTSYSVKKQLIKQQNIFKTNAYRSDLKKAFFYHYKIMLAYQQDAKLNKFKEKILKIVVKIFFNINI